MGSVVTGLYQHYKGAKYEVLGVAQHSETEETLVIYRALYGEFGLWLRPLSMFLESVDVEGVSRARFELLDEYAVSLGQFSSEDK